MCYYYDDSPAPLGGQGEFPAHLDFQQFNNTTAGESNEVPEFLFSLPTPGSAIDFEQDFMLSQLLSDGDFLSNMLDNNNPAMAAIDLMDKLEPLSFNPQPPQLSGQKRKADPVQYEEEPPAKRFRVKDEEAKPAIKPLMIDCKTVKTQEEEEEEEELALSKKRLVWTPELHERFVWAVEDLGGPNNASPKTIQVKMGVDGLTLQHIKSHLQKYRQQARKPSKAKRQESMTTTPLILGEVEKSAPVPAQLPVSLPSPAPAMPLMETPTVENEFMKMMLERSISDMSGRKVSLTPEQYNWMYLGFTIGLKTGNDANPLAKTVFPPANTSSAMNMVPQANNGFFDGF